MASRMDKYYKPANDLKKRSQKNVELYKNIYNIGEYTNIEGIATIEKKNEIDITKIQEMLKNREVYQKKKDYNENLREKESINFIDQTIEQEQNNYDIRDILNKAKDNRENIDDKYRSLKNTQYDILKGLNLKNNQHDEKYNDNNNLKELINTITNTSMLNKMGDKELSLNLLDELQSDNSISNSASIRTLIQEQRQIAQSNEYDDDKTQIDKSFYTSSLNFDEKDFDELKEVNTTLKKNNFLIKGLVIVIILAILIIGGIFIYQFFIH